MSLAATLALLVTLLHGHCAEAASLAASEFTKTVSVDSPAAAQLPDHGPSQDRHCSHCLCHVASQAFVAFDSNPIEFSSTTFAAPHDGLGRPVAGLPLFKPPRA